MAGISFKIAKTGIRYSCPENKKRPISSRCFSSSDNTAKPPEVNQHKRRRAEVALPNIRANHKTHSVLSTTSKGSPTRSEQEASFSVNLFLDGFSVGKPTEQGKQAPSEKELICSLHPYNRTSETLLQAISDGWLPGDILKEITCKYVNGSVMCEVRDYRKASPPSGGSVSSLEALPVVQKVVLRPTMENIVKDISSMAESCSWAYRDLMEIESRILKAVQPKLCLDPAPMLERLCENSNPNKLNLGFPLSRHERKQRGCPLLNAMSNNLSHGKTVSIEANIEKARIQTRNGGTTSAFEGSSISCSQENSAPTTADISSSMATRSRIKFPVESGQNLSRLGGQGPSNSLPMQGALNHPRILSGPGNLSPSATSMLGKRERYLALTGKPDLKKPKLDQTCMDKFQQQNSGPNFDTKPTSDQQRKDMPMQQNQNNECMYILDMSVHSLSKQVTTDDQLVTGGEMFAQDSNVSSYIDPGSTSVFKANEECREFERAEIGIDRESRDFARSKGTQHLMEINNDQSGSSQISSKIFSQQQHSKPSFQWQPLGQPSENDHKRDELLLKNKLVPSPREIGGVGRSVLQYPPLAKSGAFSQPLISTAVNSISLGPSCKNMEASAGPEKEKSLGLSTVSNVATSVNSIQTDSQLQQAQQSVSFSRHKSNSISKQPSCSGVPSPGIVTNLMTSSYVNSPSTPTTPLPYSINKPDQFTFIQDQSKQLETISTLVSVIHRHGLPIRKNSVEEVHEPNKDPPSWHLLVEALNKATNNEDQKDVEGQRNLSNSFVWGDVNVPKTRTMNFVCADHMYPGNSVPVLIRRNRVRLLMSECAKDGMVEAVMQFGDDQDEESLNSCPQDVLPFLPNSHFADRLAVQFSALMEKDGYELVDDQVQLIRQHQQMLPENASPTTQSMIPGASTLVNNKNQLPSSPHVMASQNMAASAAVCGIPSLSSMLLSSPNALAALQMPPPGNSPNQQLFSGFLQSGFGMSKSLQLDPAYELAVVQQQQHQQHHMQQQKHQQHHMQQQHQLQQHPQQQLQRPQQLANNPNRLSQLNFASYNPNQQKNSKFMNSVDQINMQMLHKQHQQQQLQRKGFVQGRMGSNLGTIGVGNIGVNSMSGVGMSVNDHNMGGLSGVMGMTMAGINNISASMGGVPNLTNINALSGVGGMGQIPGIQKIIEHQIRSGSVNTQTACDRVCVGPGRGRPVGMLNPSLRNIENMPGFSASNRPHSSVNLAMHGTQQGRNNMSSLQSTILPKQVASMESLVRASM